MHPRRFHVGVQGKGQVGGGRDLESPSRGNGRVLGIFSTVLPIEGSPADLTKKTVGTVQGPAAAAAAGCHSITALLRFLSSGFRRLPAFPCFMQILEHTLPQLFDTLLMVRCAAIRTNQNLICFLKLLPAIGAGYALILEHNDLHCGAAQSLAAPAVCFDEKPAKCTHTIL